jgi:hypothetical protein
LQYRVARHWSRDSNAGLTWEGEKVTLQSKLTKPLAGLCVSGFNFSELRHALAVVENCRQAVGVVNPRPAGLHNRLLQWVKKSVARSLGWYTRPLQDLNAALARSLTEMYSALEFISANTVALDQRLAHDQILLLHDQVRALIAIENIAVEEAPPIVVDVRDQEDGVDLRYQPETRVGDDRTLYVLGLFGSGRVYIQDLILQNIGLRAKYFRDVIRLYPCPTSMICSGHVTMKYVSRAQAMPAIMYRILEAVRNRFADTVFVYRHPLDSLLTNWVYWRTYVRDRREVGGIYEVYTSYDDLCADLDRDFFEFKAFAEGDLDFYAGLTGPRFLSFSEFVEESALHFQSASLALRLEDFTIDPIREFSKIVELMGANLDLSGLQIPLPRSKSFGYRAAKEKVPRFRNFINRLNLETRKRMEKIGYGADE